MSKDIITKDLIKIGYLYQWFYHQYYYRFVPVFLNEGDGFMQKRHKIIKRIINVTCSCLLVIGVLNPNTMNLFLNKSQAFVTEDGYSLKNNGAPTIEGVAIFPSENIWNTPIDHLPVLQNSEAIIENTGKEQGLHPDFGAYDPDYGEIGIPYNIVPGEQPKVNVDFYYPDESDPGPYPIPENPKIEDGSDRHILILDKDNGMLYEIYDAEKQQDGTWDAGSGAIFNLSSNALRPDGWTSADAAGLPMLPGLVRYEEVEEGEITHALRFTVEQTYHDHVWPARHHTYTGPDNPNYPWMGMRLRLKADYDLSGFSPAVQVVLTALKKYGMIVADNGGDWFISGVPDERWNNEQLVTELHSVLAENLEVVNCSYLMIDEDSGLANQATSLNITTTAQNTTEKLISPIVEIIAFSFIISIPIFYVKKRQKS